MTGQGGTETGGGKTKEEKGEGVGRKRKYRNGEGRQYWKLKRSKMGGMEGAGDVGAQGQAGQQELLIMTPLPSTCPQALTTTSKLQAKPRDQGGHGSLL